MMTTWGQCCIRDNQREIKLEMNDRLRSAGSQVTGKTGAVAVSEEDGLNGKFAQITLEVVIAPCIMK